MQKKLHNPKSQSPAVYIPCWLIQVSTKCISNNSKIVYGRLAQWSNETGKVYRSAPQLSEEVGMHVRVVERSLKELRDVGLIGTFQTIAGGSNNFEFYDHKWMHEDINSNLIYKSNPPTETSVPPDKFVGTPPTETSVSNIKEIKTNKKDLKTLVDSSSATNKKQRDYEKDKNFMSFYSVYPRKEKPKDAWKAFKSLKPDQELLLKIIEDVKLRAEKHTQWRDKQFIPLPASYLRADSFMGEILDLEEDKKQKNISIELESIKRIAEQERISQINREHELNKHRQYNQDGFAFREIKNIVAGEEQKKAMELIRRLR